MLFNYSLTAVQRDRSIYLGLSATTQHYFSPLVYAALSFPHLYTRADKGSDASGLHDDNGVNIIALVISYIS